MHIDVWCQTDVGLKRENNQDSFLLDAELGLYIVADGMGGHKGGEVASALATKTIKEVVQDSWRGEVGADPRELLTRAYKKTSLRVYEESQKNSDLRGMGTTLVAVLIRDDTVYIGNVGDSRAYLLSEQGCWQLTEDHSLLNEQLRAGLVREDNLPTFYPKNVITRSVGFEPDVSPDVLVKKLQPKEQILICSDGLSSLVSDRRISEISRTFSPSDVVSTLINEAKSNGGDDNITVLLLSVST